MTGDKVAFTIPGTDPVEFTGTLSGATIAGSFNRACDGGIGTSNLRAVARWRVTEQAERYDRIASGYERWWAPVLAPRSATLARRRSTPVSPARTTDPRHRDGDRQARARGVLTRWPGARSPASTRRGRWQAWPSAEADERLGRADRTRSDTRRLRRPLPFEDGTSMRRCPRSCSSSSPTAPGRCARSRASCARAACSPT